MRHAVCYFYLRPLLDLSGHAFFFLQRYPKMLLSRISLLSTTGENDGGIEIIGVCVKRISFPSLPLLRL